MTHGLRTFWRLPASDKWAFCEAWRLLLWIRLRMCWRASPTLTSPAVAPRRAECSPEKLAWLTAAAARRHFVPLSCLVRSLALQALLARRGIASQVCLGVRRGQPELEAHAWVELDGQVLNDEPARVAEFTRLAPSATPSRLAG